ncbi:MAG: glutaredoxin family protein [Nitrosomonadales bacterium]|nr:glutaredoxin family protein [Nitrosomonadales bacterium]
MKSRFILAGILAAAVSNVPAGELYRWVDQSGKVHYGDVPAAEAVKPEQKKFADPATPDAALPYETRRAREAFPVTLYVADNCKEPCQRARDLLNKRGVPFTEKNLVSQEDVDFFRKMSGVETVPVLVVGKNWLKGFWAEQWNGELDIAGYPKTPPYGFQPAVPPPPARKPPAQPAPEPAPETAPPLGGE